MAQSATREPSQITPNCVIRFPLPSHVIILCFLPHKLAGTSPLLHPAPRLWQCQAAAPSQGSSGSWQEGGSEPRAAHLTGLKAPVPGQGWICSTDVAKKNWRGAGTELKRGTRALQPTGLTSHISQLRFGRLQCHSCSSSPATIQPGSGKRRHAEPVVKGARPVPGLQKNSAHPEQHQPPPAPIQPCWTPSLTTMFATSGAKMTNYPTATLRIKHRIYRRNSSS